MNTSLYPHTLNMVNVNLTPASAGVYRLWQSGAIIYIGRAMGLSTTIRSRLRDHMAGREGFCTQAARGFDFEVCANPALRELALLTEFKRRYGRLPRCNDRIG